MLKRVLIGLGVLVAIVAIIFYYTLGGGEQLEFTLTSYPEFYVTGRYFEGKYHAPEAKKQFFAAKERAESQPGATLTIINYRMDSPKEVRQFIGTGSTEKPTHVPDSLEVRTFPAHHVIHTTINAHNLVMPTPEEVREKAAEFARSKGYQLDTLSYESYISDRELRVNFPVRKLGN